MVFEVKRPGAVRATGAADADPRSGERGYRAIAGAMQREVPAWCVLRPKPLARNAS